MKKFTATIGLTILTAVQAAKFPLIKNERSLDQIADQAKRWTARLFKGENIPVKNYWDWSYFVEVEIGTPPQMFSLAPDILTADSWVFSQKCWSMPCFWMPKYDSSKSSTYVAGKQSPFVKNMFDYRGGYAVGNMS